MRTPSPKMLRTPGPKMSRTPGPKMSTLQIVRKKHKKKNHRKSAGAEIDPTPRGIIFNILGFSGWHKSKKTEMLTINPQIPHHSYRLIWGAFFIMVAYFGNLGGRGGFRDSYLTTFIWVLDGLTARGGRPAGIRAAGRLTKIVDFPQENL